MYIKDAIELLHAGFSMEEIKAMDKEAPKETDQDKTPESETEVEKTPQDPPEDLNKNPTAAQKTVDPEQKEDDDLYKRIEELEAELKKAQELNNKQGRPTPPDPKSVDDILQDILLDF